jgi:hypothetical protein
MSTDRSADTSPALTEVRTVHSRALSAIARLDSEYAGTNIPDPDYPPYSGYEGPGMDRADYAEWHTGYVNAWINMADPDHDEMRAALAKVAELLEPWAGKRRRR